MIILIVFLGLVSLGRGFLVGIGINLAFDYGVVSATFANGSQIDIAKVEGSVGYKQMMRGQDWTIPDDSTDSTSGSVTNSFSREVPQHIFSLRYLRDYLPCWVAASSYLGATARNVIVVFPARPSDHLLQDLDRASSRLSLHLQMQLASPAGHLAAYANGLSDGECHGERRILSVEYSRAALTSMLFQEECGVFEDVRGSHNTSLGANYWSSEIEKAMVSELRKVARKENAPDGITQGFDDLVMLGELGHEERVKRALKQAFAPFQEIDAVVDSSEMVAPLFAAARGAALASLQREFEGSESSGVGGSWIGFRSRELR